MEDRELLELDRLREVLEYNTSTGLFHWKVRNSNRSPAGSQAGGRINSDGYAHIQIDGRLYRAHRLAWLYVHGEWPDQIDHINGCRSDNRIENLRNVSGEINAQNQTAAHRNNRSGFLGVIARPNGKYQAEIRVEGKKRHLGTFSTPEAAHAAYRQAKLQLHEGAIK